MNIKDMCISLENHQLLIEYSTGDVLRAVVDGVANRVTFALCNGEAFCVDVSKYLILDIGYLRQFGVSVNPSGQYFFIQTWENGLFCFNIREGTLLWQYKCKKAYELVVLEEILVCRFFEQCVEVLDITSGAALLHYPLGIGSIFLPIDDRNYLVGPKRNTYRILNVNLQEELKLSERLLNPNHFNTFLIDDVQFVEEGIQISGHEYSSNAMQQAIHEHKVDEFLATTRFARCVSFGA